MKVAEGIYVVPDVLTAEECREYIEFTEAKGYEAAPITTASGFQMRPDIRNNTRVIVDDPSWAEALWTKTRDEIPGMIQGRPAIGLNERFRFYRYDPGEKFAFHRDGAFRRENGETSFLTFMAYLNEGFVGGETTFQEISITPKTGMVLVFEHQLVHEGAAVVSGRKYVLRSDVMFAPRG